MLRAIDVRERRVVGVMVAKGIGGDEPLPMGSDHHTLSRPPGGVVITPGDGCHGTMRPGIRLTMSAGMLTGFQTPTLPQTPLPDVTPRAPI